ncbi:MAG: prepilin-type N-terminal cleavage/methylation domain-containing protein [Gemmatimonadales bacterium]|nr:prepilin-type N-terminal cleavage/methylation domain-containing protein [Gemmatimonadales bacterium]
MKSTKGFSTIEIIIVVVLIGIIATIGIPRIKNSVELQDRRAMRAALVGYMATARGAAVARGCRGSVHFISGANSRVWVTACTPRPGAALTERDTLAGPTFTEAQWGHRFQAGRDSISYDFRGLRQTLSRTVILIRTRGDITRDSVVVNSVGTVVYP